MEVSARAAILGGGSRRRIRRARDRICESTMVWIYRDRAVDFGAHECDELLDNMDALSAGIGVIASLVFAAILIVMVRTPAWAVAVPLLLLAGSLMGFLVWNRPPASIFMGDCGSNLIGFLLATLTVTGTFYESTGSRHVMLAPCV